MWFMPKQGPRELHFLTGFPPFFVANDSIFLLGKMLFPCGVLKHSALGKEADLFWLYIFTC